VAATGICLYERSEVVVTVYVDDMRARFGRLIMCHMIADTDEELHAMVDRIGVARKWHQGDHYDIALSKRALAVANGAIEITLRECAIMTAHRRRGNLLPKPSDVPTILAEQTARIRARLEKEKD
jgi:hypothetical protein